MKIDKVIVFHIGARDQFMISIFFHIKKKLLLLITDYYVIPGSFLQKIFGNRVSRRYSQSLDKNLIDKYSLFLLIKVEILNRLRRNSLFAQWMRNGSIFEKRALKKIKRIVNKKENYLFWGYTNTNLEVLKFAKDKENITTIHNQYDAGIEYYEVQYKLWKKHKEIEEEPAKPPKDFLDKLQAEWLLSDLIVVNSEYSKRSLIKFGVSADKIVNIPLPFNTYSRSRNVVNKSAPLRIGFVGNINIIKGFYIYFQTAQALQGKMVFTAAGENRLKDAFIHNAKKYITFKGYLNQVEMDLMYRDIDVLVFPSYSDGFGMVQLEAMSRGIPVISSESCGEVVINDKNGFIVQQDHVQIVEKLLLLDQNRTLLEEMSHSSFERLKDYSFDFYHSNLKAALESRNIFL